MRFVKVQTIAAVVLITVIAAALLVNSVWGEEEEWIWGTTEQGWSDYSLDVHSLAIFIPEPAAEALLLGLEENAKFRATMFRIAKLGPEPFDGEAKFRWNNEMVAIATEYDTSIILPDKSAREEQQLRKQLLLIFSTLRRLRSLESEGFRIVAVNRADSGVSRFSFNFERQTLEVRELPYWGTWGWEMILVRS